MIKIRRGGTGDAPACVAIAEAAYGPYVADIGRRPMPMDQDFAQAVQEAALWVAEADGVAAFVIAYRRGRAWLLENVAVDPAHHGRGIGKALIARVEALARQDGAEAVELYTNAKMTANLTLYPMLGYVETGRSRQQGFDRVFFTKPL